MTPGTRVRNFAFGDVIAFSTDTGGAYALVELVVEPRGGPPPHIHTREGEGFFPIHGRFKVWVGDEDPIIISPGQHVFGPKGVQHCFRNVGSTPGRLLLVLTPGTGFEQYLIEAENARAQVPPHDLPALLKRIDERYGVVGIDRQAKVQAPCS